MSAELFWKMNTADAADDKTTGEKHAPSIILPESMEPGKSVKIKVDVGEGKHPNTNEHHIQWVELRMAGLFVTRAEFSPVVTAPVVEFEIACPHRGCEISAIARCNLHGLWESKATCTCGK